MKNLIFYTICLLVLFTVFVGCEQKQATETDLPIMGRITYEEKTVDGKQVKDTIYHTVDNFVFYDQDSNRVTRETVEGKVYVADFFFTTCTTICPKMKKQMLRVYEQYKDRDDFVILSHSLDPTYDTVALLRDFAQKLGVEERSNWRFLTGTETDVYELGQTKYMVTAVEDETAQDGILHSGAFLLVDRQGRIRGVYDGTKPEEVGKLLNDIKLLLDSKS